MLDRLSRGHGRTLSLIHALGGRRSSSSRFPSRSTSPFPQLQPGHHLHRPAPQPACPARWIPLPPANPGLRGFFFELKEELQMLAHNINLSAGLFVIGAAFFFRTALRYRPLLLSDALCLRALRPLLFRRPPGHPLQRDRGGGAPPSALVHRCSPWPRRAGTS